MDSEYGPHPKKYRASPLRLENSEEKKTRNYATFHETWQFGYPELNPETFTDFWLAHKSRTDFGPQDQTPTMNAHITSAKK